MYLDTKTLIILLILYLNNFAFAYNEGSETDFQFTKIIQKSAEHIHVLENLKLASEEDKNILKEFEASVPKNIYPILIDLFAKTSIKCWRDLIYLFENIKSPDGWSLKMLDAYGKPESGILLGNLKWIGEYDECLSSFAPPKKNTTVGNYHGKYCTLQVPLKQGDMPLPLVIAVCLPESCNPNGRILSSVTNLKLNGSLPNFDDRIDSALSNTTLTCKPSSKKLTTAAIVVISLMSLFLLLAIIGSSITVFEYYAKENTTKFTIFRTDDTDKLSINGDIESTSTADSDVFLVDTGSLVTLPYCVEKCKPFLNCFCIFTNGEKILNTSRAEGQLPCLHGIRFLSMTWIIVCHSYAFVFLVVRNLAETIDYVDHWLFQIILNGFYSVDSFFLLSGFLVAYIFFQQVPKNDGKIPWFYFYVHRYIRLTPAYMMIIAFWTTIYPYLSSGPLSLDVDIDYNCKTNWWWNLLYINNFQSTADQCMGWSWYLANDMQFYIISPLLLVTLWRWPKIGYSILGLLFSITLISSFVISYEYNLIPGLENIVDEAKKGADYMERWTNFFDKLYIKPYTRVGPYLIGILLAYYLHKRKQYNATKLNLITLLVGWMIASGITLACVFGLYHQKLTLVGSSFYNALSHVGFALGLAWVIFVCIIGQAGVINSILSWKAWIPLSRLTYCAYLIHPIVLFGYYSSVKRLVEFNHINMVMFYLGFLIVSYSAAGIASLLFESPVIRLERLLRDKLNSRRHTS
ncbi:nose resistant to fluoxetine protein 6-like [Argiope bruennichi]|uniref:Nose resistant to fluoxetine protein 6 like protein n=1 Tax=Argiope bruennichi TaxID=94029 RepID=A0A8T0G393_ARGBR|nr:nose resistant to fluoxetine protein 6-like [Argiope bruennichi]KAF8796918.1 Nose resistant to fluoxetine protein 6 like protein [Argiope bruennichi]